MGRYPFTDCLNDYLPKEEGHVSQTTLGTTRRRLAQIGRIFVELKDAGKVSTTNPRQITAADIDAFVGYRKMNGIKNSTILKDLGHLKNFLTYFDNNAVDEFKAKYPAHIPKKYHKRGDSMESDLIDEILANAVEVPVFDWKRSEAYGLVSMAITTGLRPKELRMMYLKNVVFNDDGSVEVYAVHVKGENSYGEPRWICMHPDGVEPLKHYLEAREYKLSLLDKRSDALFPPIRGKEEFIGYNMVEKLKMVVVEDVGVNFELRKCRRTFGQTALDEGQDPHNVSLVMGHHTISTTQKYYCDKPVSKAVEEMREVWTRTHECRKSDN